MLFSLCKKIQFERLIRQFWINLFKILIPESIPSHGLVVDPDREVDDLAAHVVLNRLRCPVVVGYSSPWSDKI